MTTHRPAAACGNTGARFYTRARRCYVTLRVGHELAPCEVNNRKWRGNNWQRVKKDQRGEP